MATTAPTRHDVRMKLRHELAYDATPDEVFEMLADPAFREKVSEALNVVSHDVSIEANGDGFTLVNDQIQRTEGLPTFARKFAGDTTRAIQRETWTDRTGGTLAIDAPGKPSEIKGNIALLANGTGTTEVVEMDIKVKVPLIGGKLEGVLEKTIMDGLHGEHAVGRAWLAGER